MTPTILQGERSLIGSRTASKDMWKRSTTACTTCFSSCTSLIRCEKGYVAFRIPCVLLISLPLIPIAKDKTEYTGQESFVYKQYKMRKFDFFPIGATFRKDYHDNE